MNTFKGVALIMDGSPDRSGDVFPPSCKVDLPQLVPVTVGFGFGSKNKPALGSAKLKQEGNLITYEIEFEPGRVGEEQLQRLIPCIGGRVMGRSGQVLTHISVDQIGLNFTNSDSRIKPLETKE